MLGVMSSGVVRAADGNQERHSIMFIEQSKTIFGMSARGPSRSKL